jgi:general secretion pathway protein G
MNANTPGARTPRGFTVIEMVVAVAILALLVAGVRPLLEVQQRRAQELALREALRTLRGALDEHKRLADAGRLAGAPSTSGWPATLAVLVEGVEVADAAGGPPRRLHLLRRLPRDPFADPLLPAEQTWRLRSHDSPPDDPQPGADVFDVMSASELRALDGSRLADW